jgi:hypothetical protein
VLYGEPISSKVCEPLPVDSVGASVLWGKGLDVRIIGRRVSVQPQEQNLPDLYFIDEETEAQRRPIVFQSRPS